MTPSEIRAKEKKELWKLVEEKRRQLFEFKLQLRTGQLAKTAEVEKTRRDTARLLTILKEKEGVEVKKTNGRKKTKAA